MAVTTQQVAELYVATFNRAPDAAGLDYWVASGLTIEEIAQSFFDQTETQTLYPTGTTDSSFVTSIYTNLFNRAPDTAGQAYWEAELTNGTMTRSVMIEAMKNGALGADATIIANKTTVGLAYAAAGLEGTTFSLASVTAVAATVSAALSDVADLSAPATSAALTVNADVINGTAGNDTITGTSTTYNAGDLIIDTSSTDADILTVTATDDIAATATVVGIETVNFNLDAFTTAGGAAIFEIVATNIAATTMNVDSVKVGTSVASATVTGLKTGMTVAGSSNISTAIIATGAADNEALTVTGVAAAITANSAGTLTAATITSTSATDATLTTDSDASATLTTTATTADMIISAAAATTVTATSAKGIIADTTGGSAALTAATSVTLTALDDVDVSTAVATSATISAGTVTASGVSTLADTGNVLVTLNLSGNGSAATYNTTAVNQLKTINISGSQNVTVVMSAADIDALTAGDNKVTVVDSSTGTSTLTVGTAAGDMDLSAAAVDVINLAVSNTGGKVATFATGAALTVSADQAGGTTFDGVTATAATNTLAITLNDGTLSATPTATADLNAVTITDFASVTIDGSVDDMGATITALTASGSNTNVTYNAGANGMTLAGTSTLGTGALTINSTAAIAMGASVLTAASLTTVGAGAVTWTALDASKVATVTTGSGADALTISSTNGNLSLNTGAGNDTIIVGAATAAKTLTINGGEGALDTLNVTAAVDMTLGTSLTLSGIERLDFDAAASIDNSVLSGASYIVSDVTTGGTVAVTVVLGTDTTSNLSTLAIDTATLASGSDKFIVDGSAATSAVTLTGSALDNDLTGSNYADTITGGTNVDTIVAGTGNDTVSAGAGADFIYGGTGDDTITAGEGIDAIAGGAGADTIVLTETTAAVDYVTYLALTDGSAAGAAAGTFTGYDVVTGFATTSDKIVFDSAATISASVVVTTPVVTGATLVVAATAATNALNDMTTSNFTSVDQTVNYFNDLIASAAYTVSAASAPDVIAVTFGATTALYTITSADQVVVATEIKLLGTFDAVLVTGDIVIA